MSVLKRVGALVIAMSAMLAALVLGSSAASAAPPYSGRPTISCPAHGVVNTDITCTGNGYLPDSKVCLTLNSTTYVLKNGVQSDANGDFTVVVHLPGNVVGNHTITGTNCSVPSDTASTGIYITYANGTLDANGNQGNGNNNGGLSNTGVAVMSIGGVGVLLLVAGSFLMLSGRRRRATA